MNLETIRHLYLRRVVATTLGALGIDAATALARRLARGVFELNTAGRQTAEARFRDALGPGSSSAHVSAVTSKMYEHIGRFWVEALFARRLLRDSSWRRFVHVDGEPVLCKLAAARRGCLLATAYHGNPAVCAMALGQLFRPVHVVVDVSGAPMLRPWRRELNGHRWVRPIERREAAGAVPRVLREGGAVMMVSEVPRRRGRALPMTFLGRTLNCYPTLDRLARWFDVPVAVVTCPRGDGGFSFMLQCHAVFEPASSGRNDDAIVRRVLAVLERAILVRPEQYLWSVPAGAAGEARAPSANAAAIGMENESERSRTTRRTGSEWQKPSAADRSPGNPAVAAAPVPTG